MGHISFFFSTLLREDDILLWQYMEMASYMLQGNIIKITYHIKVKNSDMIKSEYLC